MNVRFRFGLPAMLLAVPLALLFARDAQAVPQVYDVAMSDGVTLHTRVYAPNDNFAVTRSVVLLRTPYGAFSAGEQSKLFDLLLTDTQYLNNRGLIYVTQDLRGTGSSGGDDTFRFVGDADDTNDTLAWIDTQPWSDGKVMMWGVSAPGIVSALALQDPPDNLLGVLAIVPTADVHQAFFEGGAFREELVDGWLPTYGGAGLEQTAREHEVRDAFWDDGIVSDDEVTAQTHNVKTLLVGGTQDIFVRGTTTLHQQLRALSDVPDDHFLILGPWTHSTLIANPLEAGGFIGSVKFPISSFFQPGQAIDSTIHFAAFSNWVFGNSPKPTFPQARVHRTQILDTADVFTQVRVQGSWLNLDTWPPAQSVPQNLYLYGDGGLGIDESGAAPPLSVAADPLDPVPTVGGAMLHENQINGFGGYRHQGDLLTRDDIIQFETPPADAYVDIVGNVKATIWAQSSTSDIDVHVKVLQKTNDGLYLHLIDGVRRGRFVGGLDTFAALAPDTPAAFEVDLGPLSIRLRAGHALAVMIQPSNHARFDANPQVAEPLSDAPTPVNAQLTVLTGGAHNSHIVFPVYEGELPAGDPPFPPDTNDAGNPGLDDAGNPALDDAGNPALDDAGNPALDDAGNPVLDDAGNPVLDDAGNPAALDDAGTVVNADGGVSVDGGSGGGGGGGDTPGCACVQTGPMSPASASAAFFLVLIGARRRRR